MVEIGFHPIMWHIMKIYSHYGHQDFVILLGYKGYVIKEYFANYLLHQSDCTFDLEKNTLEFYRSKGENWRGTLVETGLNAMTGARIRKAKTYIGDDPFFLTYGDGVADIDLDKLLAFHKNQRTTVTMTSVRPAGRFGVLGMNDKGRITSFEEKPTNGSSWINGGFFVCNPEIFDYISKSEECVFEEEPLSRLAEEGQLAGYKHFGFWRCMDTLREKTLLNDLWNTGRASWKLWDD